VFAIAAYAAKSGAGDDCQLPHHGELTSMNQGILPRVAVVFATIWLVCGWSAVRAADATPAACTMDARYNQQDFSLGDWDVYEGEQKLASAHIEKVLKGCAIQETWIPLGESGEHGIGLFTYSRLLGHWGYFWVADNGQTTAFTGDQRGSDDLLYVTYAPVAGGGRKERHWTLTLQSDGSIRELSVGSVDGKTWSQEYELTWRRRRAI